MNHDHFIAMRLFDCKIDAEDQQLIPGVFDIAVSHAFDNPVYFAACSRLFNNCCSVIRFAAMITVFCRSPQMRTVFNS